MGWLVVGLLIVVADDDAALRQLMTQILRGQIGAEVVDAADGEHALRVLATLRPHVLLLDIDMPQVNGLEVARRLRADPRMADLPIIAMSGWAAAEAALAAGCNVFLPKPFRADALVRQVRALVDPPPPDSP